MKKICLLLILAAFLTSSAKVFSQAVNTYTWKPFKMKFEIPSNFNVKTSNDTKFVVGSTDILVSFEPQTLPEGTQFTDAKMRFNLKEWAQNNKLTEISEISVIPTVNSRGGDGMFRYTGILLEGKLNGSPVIQALIVDPDFPHIITYIWVSYKNGTEDVVIKILKSIEPI
jgi:hypothetical protein